MNTNNTTKELPNNIFLQFLISPGNRFYRHFVLIVFIAAGIYIDKNNALIEPQATYAKTCGFIILLLLFYFNMYVLIPKYLFRNKYLEYALSLMVLIILLIVPFLVGRHFLRPYFNPAFFSEDTGVFKFVFVFPVLITASTGVKLFKRWILDTQRINELEKTTIKSELEQLKNQINPHFLFNTLNNVNVLTQKDPEKASQVLMKLSDLLRYQLYDSTRTKVLLTSDIHFIEDFLNLEKIRRDNFEFIVSKEGDLNGVQLSPLLLITFIENAVKHNMDAEKFSYVHIYFTVHNDELNFKCINSKPQIAVVKNGSGGLGLANVKRRLELLYPLKHTMHIEDKPNTYNVNLIIHL